MSNSILSSTSGLSSTKLASGLGKMFGTKVEELDRASDALESNPVASSCTALKFNYSLRKKELELQKDELSANGLTLRPSSSMNMSSKCWTSGCRSLRNVPSLTILTC